MRRGNETSSAADSWGLSAHRARSACSLTMAAMAPENQGHGDIALALAAADHRSTRGGQLPSAVRCRAEGRVLWKELLSKSEKLPPPNGAKASWRAEAALQEVPPSPGPASAGARADGPVMLPSLTLCSDSEVALRLAGSCWASFSIVKHGHLPLPTRS